MFIYRYKFQDQGQGETEFYRYTPPEPSYNDPYTSSNPHYDEHKQRVYKNYNNGNQNNRREQSYNDGRKYSQSKNRIIVL